MGHPSQSHFLSQILNDETIKSMSSPRRLAVVSGAALEKQSLKIISLLNLEGYTVLTTDICASDGVDIVWDLQDPPPQDLKGNVDIFVSCSVLEHVKDVSLSCQNIAEAMSQKGLIYISVPWVWRYHEYPGDYHRFNLSSIEELFPFARPLVTRWHVPKSGEFGNYHKYAPNLDEHLAIEVEGVRYLPYMMLHTILLVTKP